MPNRKKPSITVHGGKKEIGGNKILVEDGDTRIWLDFGMSYSLRGKFFEEFVQPRSANGLGDFLEMGLIPDLPGLYREDLLRHQGRKAEEPAFDAVLISHAHLDHCAYVSFLHEGIPIYMGETSKLILQAIKDANQKRNIETEVLAFKERPITRGAEEIERDVKTFRTGDRLKIGDFNVWPVHVDHSVPGAYGFVLEGPNIRLAYTGDLRLHGRHSEMTQEFIEFAKEKEVDILLTEGTRVKEQESRQEEEVERDVLDWIINHNGLAFVDFNFKDVDRLRTFLRVAEETDRTFVIPFKEAVLINYLSKDKKLNIPSLDNFVIFKPKRKTGTFDDKDYRKIEREYYNEYESWTYKDVKENANKTMMYLSYFAFPNLVDIKPENAIFVHSLSEPFNEEMEISYDRMMSWLDHFGIKYLHSHCSGHASAPELREVIKGINAKKIIPIHTEHPRILTRLAR